MSLDSTIHPQLLQAYRGLPVIERQVLQVLAVAQRVFSQSHLELVLSDAGMPCRDVGRVLSSLSAKRLIPQVWNPSCLPELLEVAGREASTQAWFPRLLASIEHRLSWGPPSELRVRAIRFALYRNDAAALDVALQAYYKAGLSHIGGLRPLSFLCATPLDLDWMGRLQPDIRWRAAMNLIADCHDTLTSDEWIVRWCERQCPDADAAWRTRMQAHRALLRGDFRLGQDGQPIQDARLAQIAASSALLRQDDPRPVQAHALALTRQETGRSRVAMLDVHGVLHMLSLLGHQDPAGAVACLRAMRADGDLFFSPVVDVLARFLDFVHGDMLQLQAPDPNGHHVAWFLTSLITFWTSPKQVARPFLEAYAKRAAGAGYRLWAQEAEALLDRHAGKPAAPGSHHLVDLVCLPPVVQRVLWGMQLAAAHAGESEMHEEQKAADPTPSPYDQRLAWRLGVGRKIVVEPLVQTWNRRWSPGRKLNLEHLENLPTRHLTPQDIRVQNAWRDAPGGSHIASLILPHLVGHPRLFVGTDAVQLIRSLPQLRVTRHPEGVKVTMAARPARGRIKLVQDTPTQLSVTCFDDVHVSLCRLLEAGIVFPAALHPDLMRTLSGLSRVVDMRSDVELETEASEVPCDARLHAHLYPYEHGLKVRLAVAPLGDGGPVFRPAAGGEVVVGEIRGERLRTRRNLAQERRSLKAVLKSCTGLQADNRSLEWLLPEPEACLQLLLDLQSCNPPVMPQWPHGQRFRLAGRAGSNQLRVRIEQQRDWFAISGEVRLDSGRVVGMQELLRALVPGKRFVALGQDEYLALTEEFRQRLESMREQTDELKGAYRVHGLAAGRLQALTDGVAEVDTDAAWREHLRRLKKLQAHDPKVPAGLQAELRSYQVDGFRWLSRLASWGVGACLADDMGLGKTVQSLAVILERAANGPTLVVAPASVGMNWISEAARFAPRLKVHVFGNGDRRQLLSKVGPFDLVVSTYGLLHQEAEALAGVEWETVVMDEAQAIKNSGTRRSQAAKALRARFRLATTGTPLENHLGELWNLFDFLNPGLLGSHESFSQRYAGPIENVQDGRARLALKNLLSPFILRRTKTQVLTELPPRTDIMLGITLSEGEASLYHALRAEALRRIEEDQSARDGERQFKILAELMKLRRACCHPRLIVPHAPLQSSKLEAFGRVLDDLLDNGHKALVFSQFVDHLALVREYIEARGVRYQYLDGSTPVPQRRVLVDAFQAGEGDLFLISLRAGGTGLNLTAADYVIHLDPWWNPAVEDQASDRAHRIGQQRPVTVYRLVTRGTIEEQIVDLHTQKRELADSLLDGTEMSARLSTDDLLRLLRGEAGPVSGVPARREPLAVRKGRGVAWQTA